METKQIERLKVLSNLMGVSSLEANVSKFLKPYYEANSDQIIKDRLGSIFALKKSKNPDAKTLLIATSLDEVGLMVSRVKDNGNLEFITLESLSSASLLHQRVSVVTRDNEELVGVIMADLSAMSSKESVKISDLYIDLGDASLAKKVLPGDLVALNSEFTIINQHVAVSKALNNRLLLEVGLEVLENLKDVELDYNLVVGGIAASIIGQRGTMTSAYVVKPDTAIALTGFDTKVAKTKLVRGEGMVLAYHDGGMLPSKRLLNDFSQNISRYQTSVGTAANDSSFIHKMLRGCPSIACGIAMNNTGTSNVLADLNDADELVKTITEYCKTLDSSKIRNFGFED